MLGSANPISALPAAGSSVCQQTMSWETGRPEREKGHIPSGGWMFPCCLLSVGSSYEYHPGNASPLGSGRSLQEHWNPVGRFLHNRRTRHTQRPQQELDPSPLGLSSKLSQGSTLSSGLLQFCKAPPLSF